LRKMETVKQFSAQVIEGYRITIPRIIRERYGIKVGEIHDFFIVTAKDAPKPEPINEAQEAPIS